MNDFFLIGEIKSVYNEDGYVSILSYSDFPDRFLRLENAFIEIFGRTKAVFVEDAEIIGKNILLKFRNFDSADAAEVLVDKKLYVDSENVVELDENTFFVHDLIGSKVFFMKEFIGILKEVLTLPANDVYVVKSEDKNEYLIPATQEYIESFDSLKKILLLKKTVELLDAEN